MDFYFSLDGALIPSNPGPTITPTMANRATDRTPTKTAVGAGVPVNEANVLIMRISKNFYESYLFVDIERVKNNNFVTAMYSMIYHCRLYVALTCF